MILEKLRQPRTIQMLLEHFPSYDRAKQYVTNVLRRGHVMLVGTILWHDDGGRPRNVYCRRSVPQRLLKHELTATLLMDVFEKHGAVIECGYRLPYDCDRAMTMSGQRFFWEIDMDEESKRQVRRLLNKYRDCDDLVLCATVNEHRKEEMMREADGVQHAVLFATIPEILRRPFDAIWTDPSGKTCALPKPPSETPSETLGNGETR